ncbi:MAG: SDR family NAD(P)-dependent oxidoreductase [Desulfobacterales bacterium]|nr:SDR family NAD(P)-dependent oxidoreductase [Desulfobacterales bacterium]
MNQTAFVTGAGGFIGSHIVETLLNMGWSVKALVHYNSRSQAGWLTPYINTHKGIEIVWGDICDAYQLLNLIKGCDAVFHLAALIGIPYSYQAIESYINTNVVGTLNVLKASLHHKISRFIHTSTSEVYGTAQYQPIDEHHPLQAQSPYAASKIAADKLVESFHFAFNLPTVTIRPFNTYGPRQSARAVIPSIIIQALHSKMIHLGALDPIRDFTFITDTVNGFIAALNADDHVIGQTIQLGTGVALSIDELCSIIFELLGDQFQIVTDPTRIRPEKSEVKALISNNNRAITLLNWSPHVSLKQGLSETIEWIKQHNNLYHSNFYHQ